MPKEAWVEVFLAFYLVIFLSTISKLFGLSNIPWVFLLKLFGLNSFFMSFPVMEKIISLRKE